MRAFQSKTIISREHLQGPATTCVPGHLCEEQAEHSTGLAAVVRHVSRVMLDALSSNHGLALWPLHVVCDPLGKGDLPASQDGHQRSQPLESAGFPQGLEQIAASSWWRLLYPKFELLEAEETARETGPAHWSLGQLSAGMPLFPFYR